MSGFYNPRYLGIHLYIVPTLWVLYALPRIQKTVLVWEEEEIPWFVHPRISLALLRYKIV